MSDAGGSTSEPELCGRCGHPWDDHRMHAELPYPTDGWITCPVAGCACYGTWSVDDESRAAMERDRAEHLRTAGTDEVERPAT